MAAGKVSQEIAEVLAPNSGTAKVSQEVSEVLAPNTAGNAAVSQGIIEVLAPNVSQVFVDQVAIEVLTAQSYHQVDQVAVELLLPATVSVIGEIQFFDETGYNPLPAGIEVWIYPQGAAQIPANLLGTGWTQPNGLCPIALPANTACTAVFFGEQAPPQSQNFTSNASVGAVSTATCAPYRSPSLSIQGYTQEQMNLLPIGWFSDLAKSPGGVAYTIAQGLASMLNYLDIEGQTELARMRMQSIYNLPDLVSWAMDYLGPIFQPFPGESLNAYQARLLSALQSGKSTIAAIQAIVTAFYNAYLPTLEALGNNKLAFDVAGGFDQSGAFDIVPQGPGAPIQLPTIFVWDAQTQPGLAATFGITPPQFVIQIGAIAGNLQQVLAMDVAGGYDTYGAFDVVPNAQTLPVPSLIAPDVILGLMVQFTKSAGTTPVYILGNSSL